MIPKLSNDSTNIFYYLVLTLRSSNLFLDPCGGCACPCFLVHTAREAEGCWALAALSLCAVYVIAC